VAVQQKRAPAARLPKTDLRYWESRVYRRTYTRSGEKFQVSHYSARLQHQGRQEIFNLQTSNKAAAAGRAREIYLFLLANGWTQALAKFKPKSETRAPVYTVGDLISEIRAHNHSTGRTLEEYIRNFRRLVSGVFGIEGSAKKYDYKSGGRLQWIEQIDAVRLDSLTPALIQKWKVDYLNRAGNNPARQRAAKISVNSIIRGARSLFAPRYIEHLQFAGNFRNPLAAIKLEPRQSMRHQTTFDLESLVQKALAQLMADDPEALKTLLLGAMAGLRRKEIDLLPWTAFNWAKQTLRISVTEHFAAKSQDSIGEIDLDPELVALFKDFYSKRTGEFVIESDAQPNLNATYACYRCDSIFQRLTVWLRKNGVSGLRPLHSLRKEFGSKICSQHGLFAASRALRHADIGTTASHYLDKQKRTSIGLGHLFKFGQD
jgi:hypothetical protein